MLVTISFGAAADEEPHNWPKGASDEHVQGNVVHSQLIRGRKCPESLRKMKAKLLFFASLSLKSREF